MGGGGLLGAIKTMLTVLNTIHTSLSHSTHTRVTNLNWLGVYLVYALFFYSGSGHSEMGVDELNFYDGEDSEQHESLIPSIPNASLNDSDSDEEVRKYMLAHLARLFLFLVWFLTCSFLLMIRYMPMRQTFQWISWVYTNIIDRTFPFLL